jgi:hypothetical protein
LAYLPDAQRRQALAPGRPGRAARHCAISYFIAAGLDWKQISTWAGHGDVRQTWNRYGHLVPGGEEQARERLDAFLTPTQPITTVAQTVAHDPDNDETAVNTGVLKYRYRDSNLGFRRERALERSRRFPKVVALQDNSSAVATSGQPACAERCTHLARTTREDTELHPAGLVRWELALCANLGRSNRVEGSCPRAARPARPVLRAPVRLLEQVDVA